MQESPKIAHGLVELVNVGSKLINKKGVFVIFQLSDEAQELSSFNWEAFKAEWSPDKIKSNAAELVALSKKKLDLVNKDAQAKVEKALDLGIKGGELAEKAVSLYKEGVLYASEVKALFS